MHTTIHEKLKDIRGDLHIRNNNPDVDSVYAGSKYLCAIPKCGSQDYRIVFEENVRSEGYETSDGIRHRTWKGLGKTLYEKGIIRRSQLKEHFKV